MTAFENIRVIDFSDRLSAAYAARIFGDFGADVILVEPPAGHPLRAEPPFVDGESLVHAYANWNKRSVSAAQADLKGLVANADVVVTSSSPLPADLADALNSFAPDAVHLSVTPHGLTGPLAASRGNNLTACARVGWSAINRYVDEAPLQLPHNQTGYIAGVAGFVGAAAALLRSQRNGHGERVDVSEIEALSNTCAPWAEMGNFIGGDRLAFGPNGPRERGRYGPLWPTSDGAINYGYGDWAFWVDAMTFLELPELAEDPTYAPQWGRNQKPAGPVRQALADASANRGKWELFHGLVQRRCIAGVVQNPQELLESEHLNAREFIVRTRVADRELGAAGAPAKLSATPWQLTRPAPGRGEHDGTIESSPRSAREPAADKTLPLDGIRVLCFTQAWAGTFGTELLALLGADVVQIETVKRPDVWRGAGAPVPPGIRNPDIEQNPLNTNGMYNTVNLNKRAITLDMGHPRGREMFWAMLPQFDVVADNFSPHVMENWGVNLETLNAVRPGMIMASVSGYGRTGPFAEYAANGATTEPMAGLSSIHGYEGDAGQNTGGLIPDPISGYYLAAAIIAALNHRERTGEGQRIDASMIEAVATGLGDAILEFDANHDVRAPAGNRHPRVAPHNVYATADGEWLALAAEDDEAFAALAAHIGFDASRWPTMADRKTDETAIDALIGAWAQTVDAQSAADLLAAQGLTCARVEEFQDIYRKPSEQFIQREFLVPVTHPESGTHFMPTAPWLLDTPQGEIRHSPCFGQHSQEVFSETLGITDEQYAQLEADGITGTDRLQ